MKSARPDASPTEIRAALVNSAIDLGAPGKDNVFGVGRADAESALELITNGNFDILDFLTAIIEATQNQN